MKFKLLFALLFFSIAPIANAVDLVPGTVLVSRNIKEEDNTSPGYWNHLAIYVGNGQLVESQADSGVILTSWQTYWSRPYSEIAYRLPISSKVGLDASERAKKLVGLPYATYSSFVGGLGETRQALGLNCVSVTEISYKLRNLNVPDRIFCPIDSLGPGRYFRSQRLSGY